MAVKIRLARRGRKKLALYDIVVADARAPRDGRFIAKLGNYNPNTHPATTVLKEASTLQWLLKGAQPTNTVRTILSSHGILLKKHLQLGIQKGAITQAAADKKLEAWQQSKVKKLASQDQKSTKENKKADSTTPPKAAQPTTPPAPTEPQAKDDAQVVAKAPITSADSGKQPSASTAADMPTTDTVDTTGTADKVDTAGAADTVGAADTTGVTDTVDAASAADSKGE